MLIHRALGFFAAGFFLLSGCGDASETPQGQSSSGTAGAGGAGGAGAGGAGMGGAGMGGAGAGGGGGVSVCGCAPGKTCDGLWLSAAEIAALPIPGEGSCDARCAEAYADLLTEAATTPAPPDLTNQDETTNITILAKALAFARTGDTTYEDEVRALLQAVVGSECGDGVPGFHVCDGVGARSLALGRRLAGYVIAADIIDLPSRDPDFDQNTFRPWLGYLLTRVNEEGRTLQTCHEERPNNWGTHCGASRAAIAIYLGNQAEIAQTAKVFQGWLGDRAAYAGFSFQQVSLSWMADPQNPVPVNPKGALVMGHDVDGVLVDDQSRAGAFVWPPLYTSYAYGGQEGAIVQAHLLARRGYDVFNWSDQALRRAVAWMFHTDGEKTVWDTSNDTNKAYILDLVDFAYGTTYAPADVSRPGRNVGFTSFTHRPCAP